MKLKTATIPQNQAVSQAIDTENLPLAALFHDVGTFDGTPHLQIETLAPGQDVGNPSAVWIPVVEQAPGVSTDADDAGALTAVLVRAYLGIPNLILEDANHFRLVQKGARIPKYFAAAASFEGDDAGAAFAEAQTQQMINQIARLSNSYVPTRLPSNFIRLALRNAEVGGAGVNQTTAARVFTLGFAEAVQGKAPSTAPKFVDVTIPNGDADSNFFELAPGERIVGIVTPAAFTAADLNLQTVKPGLDPAIITDANWVNLVEYLTERTLLTGSTAGHVWFWAGASQGQYMQVGELNVLEMPRFLRLHGSGNQAAARVVRIFIE